MIAILGGLGAAVAWALSTLCSSRSSRMIGASSAVAWLALAGLLVNAPVAAAEGVPAHLDGSAVGWLLLAGMGNVVGLLLAYLAYRVGDVSLVAPVISTEGAIAALIAIVAGEQVGLATALVLLVIAAGIALAASAGAEHHDLANVPHPARIVLLAVLASLCFGVSLYATGRVSTRLPLAWVVLPPRLIAALLVAIPLVLVGRLRLSRPAVPLVLTAGISEVLGFASFSVGARHGIAIAAILSCQFAAISAVAGYRLFGERLARPQLAGVLLLVVGVSVLSGLRA
jgi:drug/metabolite transporter (DMT)-like permease